MNIKNKIKSISLFIATIAIAVLLSLTIVDAETAAKTLTIKSTAYKKTPMTFPQTFHIKKTSSGKFVYCLTYAKKTPSSGVKYTKSSLITDNGENYILKEAYKKVNSNSDFFIYQTALWIYMSDRGLMDKTYSVNTFRTKVYNSNSKTAKKIRSIVASAKKAGKNDKSAPSIKLSSSNLKLSLDSSKKYYVSSKIKVTSSTSKYKVSFTNAPNGTKYEIKGNYLYVSVPASSIKNLSTNFKVNVSNTKTTYTSYMYKPSNKAYQKMTATYKDVKNAKDSINLNITKTVNVPVNKVDSDTGSDVKGAKLQVKNANGKVIDSWTTDGKAHSVTNLSEGTYTLEETQAPDGYILSNTKTKFTIDATGTIKNSNGTVISNIIYKNTKTIKVNKIDSENNNAVKGAKLQIKNSSGKVVDSWTTDGKAHSVTNLSEGTYILEEAQAPDGYILSNAKTKFTVDESGEVKGTDGKRIITLDVKNTKNSVSISKQDVTTNKEVPGATLILKDEKGNKVYTWVSTDKPHVIKGITAGSYELEETIAPNGYVISKETVKFTINNNGKVVDKNGKEIDKIIMYNTPRKENNIKVIKKDVTTDKALEGASLTITDSKNNVIDTWVSTTDAHVVKDIKEGTYTLKETKAPNGYVLSGEKIKFTVDKAGKITDKNNKELVELVMYNKPSEYKNVIISKQDIVTSKELPGANLTVKDASGKVIDSWTSTSKSHEIKDIKAGTYTLEETQAPNGYVLSSEKIKFTINNNGKITDEAGNEISKVVMFNKKIPTTDVEISKRDITTNNELPGANLTVKDASGKVIDSWTSTNATHKIKGLTEGEYTLTETQAPNGYVLSTETITFKVNSNGQLLNSKGNGIDKVVMYNEKQATPSKVRIVKQDATTNKNLAGATLEVKDKNNKVLATWVSTDAAYELDLTEGEYTLTETKAPNGYILNNTPIIFKVTSTGEVTDVNGKIMNTIIIDNTKIPTTTKVSISKKDITNGNEVPGAKLVVKDKNSNVVDSWTSTNTPHIITGLTEGEYTLNEVIAPNGYILSNETIKFTVKADGTTTNVVMYNTPKSTTPNKPATPTNNNNNNSTGKEIEVENTGSFKNIMTSLMGILTITLGGRTIIRKTRKEN